MIREIVKNNIGIIYLDRADKINALNLDMIYEIYDILEKWKDDSGIRAVLFDSLADKGFCAGGDLKEVYEDYLTNDDEEDKDNFFRTEFELDKYIERYEKPIISHWFGITMGGGIGLTINSDIIITDETTNWAMPETRLGFVPDVGVGKEISKLPQALGQYLALTGSSLGASDLIKYDLADFYIKSSKYEDIINKLFTLSDEYEGDKLLDEFRKVLREYGNKENTSKIEDDLGKIEEYFSLDSYRAIYEKLKANTSDDFARKTLANQNERFLFMLSLQFEKYFLCKDLTYAETIDLDYEILEYSVELGSMEEGIRVTMIDKEDSAKWPIQSIDEVDMARVKDLLGIDKTYEERLSN